ncbi:hypothetical protein [Caproicibacterium sp. XB2]|uniref:hypothetical protein n=1 Tax=Caproicibacterium sp. XB2 TaxID=3388458 RepID=UPI00384FAF48
MAAAMVSSAFAMSTATAFATAPTLPTAKAQLENSTVYMAKGGNTTVNVTKAATSNLFKELDANSTAANLNIKSVTTTDGTVLDTSDITAIGDTNATATADNTVVKVDNAKGNISFTEQKAGTQQVTVSGLQCTAGGKTYNLVPITFDIDLVDTAKDDGGYISTVWSSAKTDANIGNTVDSINVGGNAYLYSETVAADDSKDAFATPAYISAVDKTASSDTAVLTVDTNKATGVAVGSATASYLYNNKNKGVKETKTSPELSVTTAPVITTYDNVSAIKASTTTKGSYEVTYGSNKKPVTMTNDQLAKVTLKLAGTTSIPAGATIGTLDINGNSVTIDGATVKKVTDTKAGSKAEVTVNNTLVGTTKHDAAVSTKVDSIDTKGAVNIGNENDVATTTVGSVKTTASASTVDVSANKDKAAIRTKVNSITANNIEINSAKASIGVITKASTDSQGTLQMNNSSSTEDIILPAVDGYNLTVNGNTTVASIADCPSASIASGKTLTVSGKATFTGNVITTGTTGDDNTGTTGDDKTGTLAIAPNSLTILGNGSDAFTLKVNDVKNGDTAFMTKDNAKAIAYTNDGNDKENENQTAYANIVTPGYTAEQKAGSKNAVVRDVTVGSLTDATQGSKLNSNGTYDVEIVSGETKQLAVNPYPASSFGDNFYINWSYTDGKNADFKLGTVGASGLTNTITGTYDKNNTATSKTQKVTAQLYKMDETTGNAEPVKGKSVTYNVTVTDKKSVATTDFTLTADKNVIKPSESMTLTAAPNGSSPLTDVTAKSSNDFVATVPTSATDNALKVTATGKTGTAVITVTATLPDGSKVSHVYTVSVTNTPVVAIVNGKIVGPTDIVKVTQSTAQHVTFIAADGKKFTDFKYTAGNDKVMQTRAYPSKGYTLWDGMSGDYGMYMNGGVKDGVGDKTGVYVNGQLAFTVQVTDRPFQCDTTQTVDLKKGNTYCFKITPKTTVDNFTFNTARDAALTTCGLQKNADGSYLCKVHGTQTGSYGVYITLNGQQYKVFAVNVK